ncbi:MAG TPA: radical SAM protein [Desulfosporosinus sp.]|nr:radical SAM protein [Desulfosporosinus sp.]
MIKCSAGTAKVLGFKDFRTDALPTTAYLMTGERCTHDCSFCSQARNSSAKSDLLSRVTWPSYGKQYTIDGIITAFAANKLKRACFQVVNSQDSLKETRELLQELHGESSIPLCVSSAVETLESVRELIGLGADRISIALDAACERVFSEHKSGSWNNRYEFLTKAAEAFPGRIATHLVVGLGETEEEMHKTIQEMVNLKVSVALFAFTPIRGTKLEKRLPPALDHYRRIQAARYLMVKGLDQFEQMTFSEGKLTAFGLERERWLSFLADGEAFRTSGCPDCNRPYYNEKPGGVIYNYPRPLTEKQCRRALAEIGL